MVRLNFDGDAFSSGQDIFQKHTIKTNNEIYSDHNSILQVCGYGHLLFENAAFMLIILAVVSIVWLFIAIK